MTLMGGGGGGCQCAVEYQPLEMKLFIARDEP